MHASRHVAPLAAEYAVPAPPRKARVLRYSIVTLFGAPTNIVLYALLLRFTNLSAAWATVIAALFVIIPKFALSKYWVWKQASREHLRREVSIYVGLTATSLALATLVGVWLESLGATNGVLVAGNLGAFTVMWVVRFVILDRFAFVSTHHYARPHQL
jgi:putative flippase GtrA